MLEGVAVDEKHSLSDSRKKKPVQYQLRPRGAFKYAADLPRRVQVVSHRICATVDFGSVRCYQCPWRPVKPLRISQ
jgi:hypothetical protein